MSKNLINSLPIEERPYEKAIKFGFGALSDSELIAIIIKTGSRDKSGLDLAREILSLNPSYKGLTCLNHLSVQELESIRGIGHIKAISLLCIAEIAKRMMIENNPLGECFHSPSKLAGFFMCELMGVETEKTICVFLDTSYHIIRYDYIFSGTKSFCIANPREILKKALQYDSASIVIVHNHPSGITKPSEPDIDFTKRLCRAGEIVGIEIVDHIIIGKSEYFSMRENSIIQ